MNMRAPIALIVGVALFADDSGLEWLARPMSPQASIRAIVRANSPTRRHGTATAAPTP